MRSWKSKLWRLIFGSCLCFCSAALCAEPTNTTPKVITRPALAHNTNALASFHLRPGFRLEVAAVEPMVVAPVAMAFDENGRLFVAEMRDYPDRLDAKPHLGRIRLLEGLDKEGVFQTSTIYADDLPLPSAVACYAGGVFVAVTPQIIFLKSSQGEAGTADTTKVVFTGFGGSNAPSPKALLNNFNWGLDNRIHGATAGIGGVVAAKDWAGSSVSLAGSDFAFDPRTLALEPETGPAESGLTFTDQGRKLVCDFAHPLRLVMYEQRYALRNPFWPKALELVDIASPATPIYRYSTRTGTKPVPIPSPTNDSDQPAKPRTNVLSSTWLTMARGCVVYRGSAFGTNFAGNVFVPDPEAHAVHRFVLRDQGFAMSTETPIEERPGEFLASDDPSFRPVQAVNGPDGTLYIADMGDGSERGRIYRIVPQRFQRPEPPQLGKSKTYDLVAALAKPDGWQRDTAARLLFERRDAAAPPLLAGMLTNSKIPLARLHALHALAGSGGLTAINLLSALRDSDPAVREQGILLSEQLARNEAIPDGLWNQLKFLAADPALRVRYQLAFTLGQIRGPDRALVLADILSRDLGNPWIQTAVISSLPEGAGDLFSVLAGAARFRNDPAGLAFLGQLATLIGTQGRMEEVTQVQSILLQPALDRLQAFTLIQALGEGLHRTRSSLALVDPQSRFGPYYAQALNFAIDVATPESARVSAVRLLAVSPYKFNDLGDWMLMLCAPPPSPALQSAAIDALGRFDEPGVVQNVFASWPNLGPALRQQAVANLLGRTSHVGAVLDAIETRRLPAAGLYSTQANFLRNYGDPAISQRALRLLGPTRRQRPEVVAAFKPALRLPGRAIQGRQIFLNQCAGCHSFNGQGRTLGPDLTAARIAGNEKLLSAILEPNANVRADYATCVIITKEGENHVGIKTDENLDAVTLGQPGGVRLVWPRLNIQSLQTQPWSLMPEGLEQSLSIQDAADLLDYLMTASR